MRERGEFELRIRRPVWALKLIIEQRWGLTLLTHEGKVNVQAAFVINEGGVADAV
jgi:hypothetical protein